MTPETFESRATKEFVKRRKLINQCKRANKNLDTLSLLNWAMNQLFNSARELELLSAVYCRQDSITSMGCDATAETILKQLVKTKGGYELVKQTNPKLLKGYKKP